MVQEYSFKQYINTEYKNELFDASNTFLQENYEDMDLFSHSVKQIDTLQLDDITVKRVYIEDNDSMTLVFDVLVEAEILVQESNRHDDFEDSLFSWLRIRCTGELESGINGFQITNVELYDQKGCQFQYQLSDSLIPVFSKNDLDRIAENFLRKYVPKALETPIAIDPKVLVHNMGLTILEKELTEDCSVFGRIYFQETDDIQAGTILVDSRLEKERNQGSVNNTIVHECVHWDKHRKPFELARFYDNELLSLEKIADVVKDKSPNWMEWQARALTPKIMMPEKMFRQETEALIQSFIENGEGVSVANVMEQTIEQLAETFDVSRLASKIRLVELGYEEAIGAFNYIDGRYVPMHSWKKGAIENTETFSVGLLDIALLVRTNPRLFQAFQSGAFVYVESHICLNDSKYIEKDCFDNVVLTEYARNHMDECCLHFKISVSLEDVEHSVRLEFILNRDDRTGIKFILDFPSEKNEDVLEKAETLAHHAKNMIDVVSQLPRTFGQSLNYLRNWKEMTLEELSEASMLSPETISRMQTKGDYNPKLESVIALCIGLQLPPMLSYQLIELAGHQLRPTVKEHIIYEAMIGGCASFSVYECNELLIHNDLKPLVKEI